MTAVVGSGPGVHAMAGVHAAQRILRREFGIRTDPLDLLNDGRPARSDAPQP